MSVIDITSAHASMLLCTIGFLWLHAQSLVGEILVGVIRFHICLIVGNLILWTVVQDSWGL